MNGALIATTIVLTTFGTSLQAADYFVAPKGSDDNPGTLAAPLATIQRGIRRLKPGDTLYIRAGRYHEEVKLNGVKGQPGKPITITRYQDEKAVLDGTVPIEAEWTRCKGCIWKATIDRDVWQLFVDDVVMTPARWPNALIHDGSAWDMKGTWRHVGPGSTFGRTIDGRPPKERRWDTGKKRWVRDPLGSGINEQSLADTGIDMTGAVAILNIGSWLTWAQTVGKHLAGSNEFTYSTDFGRSGRGMGRAASKFAGNEKFWRNKMERAGEGHYYLEGKLELLDSPGEWFYEPESKTLYLWTLDGDSPAQHEVRGKTRTYALQLRDCSHVTFRGLNFFGTTFRFTDCHHLTVEDCELLYPSQSKLMLRDFRRADVTEIMSSVRGPTRMPSKSHSNVVRNCEFRYVDGPAIDIAGVNDLAENCLFEYVDVTCLGTGAGGTINAIWSVGLTFRRNTIHTAGNSEGFRAGRRALIELNNIHNVGLTQHDGSAINVGIKQQEGTVVRYNWCHNTNRGGIRFDAVDDHAEYGMKGQIYRNVVWRSDRISVKGDQHEVLHNTAFDNRTNDIMILNVARCGGINRETITRNNLVYRLGAFWHWRWQRPIPGICDHNVAIDVRDVLRDPDNLDFRPKRGSPLIDAGTVAEGKEHRFVGKAPDIGAYEHGDKTYWIPGRQTESASTPVPPDGSRTVKVDADLMWLGARQAARHRIYVGLQASALQLEAEQTNNILSPGPLVSGQTYFWRVDTVDEDSRIITGQIWSFRCK